MWFNRSSTGFYSKITLFFIILFSLYLPVDSARTLPESTVGILWFNSYGVPVDTIRKLDSYLLKATHKNRLFKTPVHGTAPLWYEYETGNSISPWNLSRYEVLCSLLKCRYLLMGMVYPQKNNLLIQVKIYSSPDKVFIYTLDQTIEGGDLKKAATLLTRNVTMFFDGKLPTVSRLSVSRGTSRDAVSMKWTSNTSGNTYRIYRSPYHNGPYEAIGETDAGRFSDSTAEIGIKYWYRVTVTRGEISGITASGYGYRKPPNPKGLTYNDLLDDHNKPWPKPATEVERALESRNLKLYEKYYESYFMMTFIIMAGRMYINSGELIALRGFKFHSFDQPNRIVYFSKPGMPLVKFYSRRFFRFFRDVQIMKLDFYAIRKRLIDNAVMFCIRSGDKEIMEPDSRIRYVPTLEVVGMMTEYHRDYEKWKGNVIVFATSDEEIYRKIREAQMRSY